MTIKTLNKRLEALDRKITQADPARWDFLSAASKMVVAYYAGDPQPDDTGPTDAYYRALGYCNGPLKYSDVRLAYNHLKWSDYSEIKRRYDKASRPVFEKFEYDYSPKEKWEEGINKLAEQLPLEWRELIQRDEYESDLFRRDFRAYRRITIARSRAA